MHDDILIPGTSYHHCSHYQSVTTLLTEPPFTKFGCVHLPYMRVSSSDTKTVMYGSSCLINELVRELSLPDIPNDATGVV